MKEFAHLFMTDVETFVVTITIAPLLVMLIAIMIMAIRGTR